MLIKSCGCGHIPQYDRRNAAWRPQAFSCASHRALLIAVKRVLAPLHGCLRTDVTVGSALKIVESVALAVWVDDGG